MGAGTDLVFPDIFCIFYIEDNQALDVDGECRRIRENGPDLPAEFPRPPTASRVLYYYNER